MIAANFSSDYIDMDTFKTAYHSWAKFKLDENTINTRGKHITEVPEATPVRIQPSLDDIHSDLLIENENDCEPMTTDVDVRKDPAGKIARYFR